MQVTQQLNCTKKRRIYDVSNVLEGVGLIRRMRKNHYTYYGKPKNERDEEVETLEQLKTERDSLVATEKELDK
jgi:hypothetical protein